MCVFLCLWVIREFCLLWDNRTAPVTPPLPPLLSFDATKMRAAKTLGAAANSKTKKQL